MEVFKDDFSVYGTSFDHFIHNLNIVLQRCEETNLVLNWEKCHFMVNEGIVLNHKISERGIEVDKAKIEAIERMPYPRASKVFIVFSVMLVYIEDLLRTFLRLRDPSLIFSRRMFLLYFMKIVRKPSKFLRKI